MPARRERDLTGRIVLLGLLVITTGTIGACLILQMFRHRTVEERDLGERDRAPSDLQAKRKARIDAYIRQGVFAEVRFGDYPTILVTPLFYRLDNKTRDDACMTVVDYQFKVPPGRSSGELELVYVKDRNTGKLVGMAGGPAAFVIHPDAAPDFLELTKPKPSSP